MRKLRWILLTVFTLLCIISPAGITYAKSKAELVASSATTDADKASVNIDLKGNTGVWGLKFKVGYDHSALKLTSAQNGKVFSDSDVTMPDTLDKEEYVFLASSNQLKNIETSDIVLTLSFKTVDYAPEGTYPIQVTLIQAVDVKGKIVDMDTEDGAVTVFYDTKDDDIVFDKTKNEGIKIPLGSKTKVKKIEVNQKKIDQNDYSIDTDGNVVISPDYLKNLKDGKYRITIETKKKKVKKDFYVKTDGNKKGKEESNNEKAGEDNQPDQKGTSSSAGHKYGIWIGAFILAVFLIGGILIVRIRKKKRSE